MAELILDSIDFDEYNFPKSVMGLNLRILGSLMTIGITIMMICAGTLAYADRASTCQRDFSYIDGDLQIIDSGKPPWVINSMTPGEEEDGKVILDYTGTNPANSIEIKFDVATKNQDSSIEDPNLSKSTNLASKLIIKSMKYGGKNLLKDVKNYLNCNQDLSLAKINDLTLNPTVSPKLKNVPPADGRGGETKEFSMRIKFDEDARNRCSNDSVSFDVSFVLLG